jgi:hypothetical protein
MVAVAPGTDPLYGVLSVKCLFEAVPGSVWMLPSCGLRSIMLVLLSWTTITAPRFGARPKAAAREQSDEPFCLPPKRGSSSIHRSAARHGTAPVAALGEHRGASPRDLSPQPCYPALMCLILHMTDTRTATDPRGARRGARSSAPQPCIRLDHTGVRTMKQPFASTTGLRGGGSILADGAKARVCLGLPPPRIILGADYPGRVIGAEALKSLLNLVMRIISSREVRHRAEPHLCGPDATAR